ncbi:MAG: hypothetical protein NZ482_08830 [Gloeomargarita sp. SKYG98]|nr:hypothetical protein [Gloeomargarita sp. SKYG98]
MSHYRWMSGILLAATLFTTGIRPASAQSHDVRARIFGGILEGVLRETTRTLRERAPEAAACPLDLTVGLLAPRTGDHREAVLNALQSWSLSVDRQGPRLHCQQLNVPSGAVPAPAAPEPAAVPESSDPVPAPAGS